MTLYQAIFVNRSRMRRDFIRTIRGLELFKPTVSCALRYDDVLNSQAVDFDQQLRLIGAGSSNWDIAPSALFDWVHVNQLWVSQSVVELGFDQGIYDYAEYDYLIRYVDCPNE
jgi:hypothetical protein